MKLVQKRIGTHTAFCGQQKKQQAESHLTAQALYQVATMQSDNIPPVLQERTDQKTGILQTDTHTCVKPLQALTGTECTTEYLTKSSTALLSDCNFYCL